MSAVDRELIALRLVVPAHYDRWRLDHFICARIPRLSRSRVQQMLRAQLNYGGAEYKPAQRVVAGQEIVLLRPAPVEPEVPRHFAVVYEDAQIIAIDKPAGLPVHATARYLRNTLTALLAERYPEQTPVLCHRLDKETSGLMLLARDKQSEVRLKGDFFHRRIAKRYLAITWGDPGPDGVIDAPIGADPHSAIRIKMATGPHGLPARTAFRCLERRGRYGLVECAPETGRQHQIRVHLAARGTPIVGDKIYGPDEACLLRYLDEGWSTELAAQLELPRHALHAAELTFRHPRTGSALTLKSALSPDLWAFWEARSKEA